MLLTFLAIISIRPYKVLQEVSQVSQEVGKVKVPKGLQSPEKYNSLGLNGEFDQPQIAYTVLSRVTEQHSALC